MAKYLDQTGLKYFWQKIKGHCSIPLGIFRRDTTASITAGNKLYLRFDDADIYDSSYIKFTKDGDGYGAISCVKNCKARITIHVSGEAKSGARSVAFGISNATSGTPDGNMQVKQYTDYAILMNASLIVDLVAGRKYYLYFGGTNDEVLTGARIYVEKING